VKRFRVFVRRFNGHMPCLDCTRLKSRALDEYLGETALMIASFKGAAEKQQVQLRLQ
jgi:hypothetical protein